MEFEDNRYISGGNYRVWATVNDEIHQIINRLIEIDKIVLKHLSGVIDYDGVDDTQTNSQQ